jgi:REP element-mobilizing transposase RayT
VRQRYPFSLYGYALMPNHFHLLLEVHRFPTARILQSLLTGYARRFNKIHHQRIPTQIDTHSVSKSALVPMQIGNRYGANRHPV